MPLTPAQLQIIEVLSPFRDQHNYVAGGAVLNEIWPRISLDIDVFHDAPRSLYEKIEQELDALRTAGFQVFEVDRSVESVVARTIWYGEETNVEWMYMPETSLRYFPASADEKFGFRLHRADIAVNKVRCATTRRQARDFVDLANIVQNYAPLGPLVWAAVAKDPEETNPVRTIQAIRNTAAGFADIEIESLSAEGTPMTREEVHDIMGEALDGALAYCTNSAPLELNRHLFVDAEDRPVEADEDMISSERARALPIQDFGSIPKLSDRQ